MEVVLLVVLVAVVLILSSYLLQTDLTKGNADQRKLRELEAQIERPRWEVAEEEPPAPASAA